ncbi:hypothetical protein JP75_05200 [Devosia riboflavina]|uniref:Uncharacterized protein n=1 Tax=Devosia riboflavina TaxID=46914 RepID=A0A087M638_9HYPH|nr:hypothetical protein [Devosia riboflavina]KFL32341.1 hypothetical protein JP75_05200 [Devosia riboflavina]
MIERTPLSNDEKHYLAEVESFWNTLGPLLQQKGMVGGGMQWKTVGGREYLYRYQPDPVTKKKRSTSVGPRSPETETLHVEFLATRERVRSELAELAPRIDVLARMGKALRLNRVPNAVTDILEVLHQAGILDLVPLAGRHAVEAFEVRYGLRLDRDDIHGLEDRLEFMVPDDTDLVREMTRAFFRVDPDYRVMDGNMFRGSEGPDIRLTSHSELVANAQGVLPDEYFDLFLSLLEDDPITAVAVSKAGRPVQICAVQPALWAVVHAVDDGSPGLANAVAALDPEVDGASRDRIDELIGLLADRPDERGPRL